MPANFTQRASFVRHQLEQQDMPVADAPEDDEIRQTYNFAPGSHGLVYRADVPDHGDSIRHQSTQGMASVGENHTAQVEGVKETRYKLQAMNWGACSSSISIKLCQYQQLRSEGRTGPLLDKT